VSARGLLFVALLTPTWACGDDVVPPVDAAPDTNVAPDAAPMLVVPEAPAAPSMVEVGACPSGWGLIDVAGAAACQPWDESGPGCEGADVRFPGDAACAPLGPACPMGRFPADVVAPALFVEAGATAGDGTEAMPFGTIAEAVLAAVSGDTIVVAGGTYLEDVALPDGVSLRGACVAETIVEGSAGPLNGATILLGEGSSVRDLSIRGLRPGLRADGVSGSAESVRVEGDGVGVVVINGGELTANGIAVVGTTGDLGAGLFMLSGSRATIERAWFDDNRSFGVAVGEPDTELTLRRAVIQRTRVQVDDTLGIGVVSNNAALVLLEESVVRQNHTTGFAVQDDGFATIRMTVVRDNLSQTSDGLLGIGLLAQSRGTATIERSLLERNRGAALASMGLGTHVDGSDLVLLSTLTHADGEEAGIGAIIAEGATAELERIMVRRAEGLGINVIGLDTQLVARDVVVREIQPRPIDMAAGRGIDIEGQATAELSRVLIEDVYGSAILAVDIGSEAVLTDIAARDIRSDARTRASGRGLTLQFGGCVEATRFLIEAARDVGILAYGEGVELRAIDLAIDDTLPRECAVDTCADHRSGTGITASDTAIVDISRFRVAGSALAGLQIARGARITARDGLVARNAVGVNVQDDGFDPSDVSMGVQFVDNGINLDASALPIPEPSER